MIEKLEFSAGKTPEEVKRETEGFIETILVWCQSRNFSSEFNPRIRSCNPGTENPDFRKLLLETAQILLIVTKMINF
jgi:hypothetical protein